ncbi:hypothetical protein DRO69_00920 [Candidatus Bathyarchaeota archaeon]|nr:MAG: hypothetical protein DRO69_00920 [Candidatus Bathyarchaeota archaeon]
MEELQGTIIDIETIGEFLDCDGLERYKQIKPIVVGFLDCDMIEILYITEESDQDFAGLRSILKAKLSEVNHPFYAFNTEFEMGVLYWFLGEKVTFDRDLMLKVTTAYGQTVWESKRCLVKDLGIPNFDDPFWDIGYKVPEAWENFQNTGNSRFLWEIIRHNRACLLKEYEILRKRKKWREVNKTIIDWAK